MILQRVARIVRTPAIFTPSRCALIAFLRLRRLRLLRRGCSKAGRCQSQVFGQRLGDQLGAQAARVGEPAPTDRRWGQQTFRSLRGARHAPSPEKGGHNMAARSANQQAAHQTTRKTRSHHDLTADFPLRRPRTSRCAQTIARKRSDIGSSRPGLPCHSRSTAGAPRLPAQTQRNPDVEAAATLYRRDFGDNRQHKKRFRPAATDICC